ncbi:two-component system sensor histidine kinase NtrB [Hirschia maritima]|uniref:two-component system sensor histidine kinase NtrB n=1 Tax=Hirschia maritima TaxID=1121961 RepID=UPI00037F9B8E|nr:ATP-binding protein [Hirschia maritima]
MSMTLSDRILDTLPVAVICVGKDGVIQQANPMAESILCQSHALLINTNLSKLTAEDSPIVDLVQRASRDGGTVYARNIVLSGPFISPTNIDATAALSANDDIITISLSPAAYQADHESKSQSAAMAEVARILGHEVKNPLAGIVGAAQLLARQARDDQMSMLTLIKEEGARIGRLVDRFAAFETFFRPRPSMTNIHQVLDRIMEMSSASFAEKIKLTFRFDPSLPDVYVDPDHIHEACLNLVKNAAEAIPKGKEKGHIHISTRYRAGVTLRHSKGEKPSRSGAIEIAIKDNGPGVPKAVADQIFTPFFSTKKSGAGIGLTVVSEIISAHSGFVELENSTSGACFKLLLPISIPKT